MAKRNVIADLHMHSTYSDGCLDPDQMFTLASQAQLTCVALSDHDSVSGIAAMERAASQLDSHIQVVPGVEISTCYDGRDVHMLGYFVDSDSPALREAFEVNRARREERACLMADKMAAAGYAVSADEMRASGCTLNRTLLARMLYEKGYASGVDDAFSRLIGRGCEFYVENVLFDTAEAVHLIREAGGYAFMAHPAQYKVVDLVAPLKREGLCGIEAFHTMQTQQESEALVQLAGELGLAVSGGSDWHGDETHGARPGSAGLEAGEFEEFLRACERA